MISGPTVPNKYTSDTQQHPSATIFSGPAVCTSSAVGEFLSTVWARETVSFIELCVQFVASDRWHLLRSDCAALGPADSARRLRNHKHSAVRLVQVAVELLRRQEEPHIPQRGVRYRGAPAGGVVAVHPQHPVLVLRDRHQGVGQCFPQSLNFL